MIFDLVHILKLRSIQLSNNSFATFVDSRSPSASPTLKNIISTIKMKDYLLIVSSKLLRLGQHTFLPFL